MEELKEVDIWQESIKKDIEEIKLEQKNIHSEQLHMKDDIKDLKYKDREHDKDIRAINKTLGEISEDTKWIKRTIIKAIITAIATGVIGGYTALTFAQF